MRKLMCSVSLYLFCKSEWLPFSRGVGGGGAGRLGAPFFHLGGPWALFYEILEATLFKGDY